VCPKVLTSHPARITRLVFEGVEGAHVDGVGQEDVGPLQHHTRGHSGANVLSWILNFELGFSLSAVEEALALSLRASKALMSTVLVKRMLVL
jgi:hypothetical protein